MPIAIYRYNMGMDLIIKEICEDLDIEPPAVEIVDRLDTATKLAAYNPDDNIIYIRKASDMRDTLFAVAHELRHVWQLRNEPDMFAAYRDSASLPIAKYNLQPAEIDANAYAMLFMVQRYGVAPQFNGLSPKAKRMIRDRATEISGARLQAPSL